MGKDIARDEAIYTQRAGDIAAKSTDIAGQREATLGPLEKQLTDKLAEPYPERPKTAVPEFKPQPIIDAKDYEQLSYGLIAMAMIGGIASKGKWLEVGDALNGALSGYLKGNQEVAKKRYEDYTREFQGAMAKEAQANREFEDILRDKKMRIQDQISQYRIVAAKYDRQDALVAAQSRSLDAMWRSIESRKTAMYRLQESHDRAQEGFALRRDMFEAKRADAAKASGTGTLSEKYTTDEAYKKQVDFWAKYVAQGNNLPPRFAQSGAGKAMFQDIVQVVPTVAGSPEAVRAGAVALTGEKSQARAVGTRAATVEMAAGEARNMANIVLETSEKFPRSSYQPVNKALMSFEKNTGNVEARQFGAAVNSYINAYSRAIAPTGVATVADKEHAREILSTADSHEQLKGLMTVLDREMAAAQKAPKDVKADLAKSITGGNPSGGPAVGEKRTINGTPAEWDGKGWKAAPEIRVTPRAR